MGWVVALTWALTKEQPDSKLLANTQMADTTPDKTVQAIAAGTKLPTVVENPPSSSIPPEDAPKAVAPASVPDTTSIAAVSQTDSKRVILVLVLSVVAVVTALVIYDHMTAVPSNADVSVKPGAAIDLGVNTASMRPRPTPYQPKPSDVSLANSISEQLQHAPNLTTAKIKVAAENGRVTLTGTVDTAADREEAARIAAAPQSVTTLINSLVAQAAETSPASQAGTTNAGSPAQQPASMPQSASTWTDPRTGLMWAREDNGSDVNWNQASNYCRNLTLGGYSSWRLATIGELYWMYDPTQNGNGYHIKGGIKLSGQPWSGNAGRNSGEAWNFNFLTGVRNSLPLDHTSEHRVLCVRR